MIIKCKMCGGDLSIQGENPVCECEFCGTQQTIPQANNEKKINLFNRANRLRMNSEFDKAAAVYASITAEFPEEAEAFWGLCLCKYGIEYVDDPKSGNKIPTCHRTLPESIMDDSDFEQACEYADPVAKRMYREEAKEIDRLQQSILSIVANEQPYDVFICYKETDENGDRTEDSVIAQDIYDSLTGKGLKVFFARITLEDKLGQEYEPYIYAALHSSKVMLAIGTKYEYYDAVWVKNEWARFLNMMKTDRTKTLIPCYKNLDTYDMPKEFKNLQAQDMNKLGWQQDLTRGVMKICGKDNEKETFNNARITKSMEEPVEKKLLFEAKKSLIEDDWDSAYEYAESVLEINSHNAQAYLIKLLADYGVTKLDELDDFEYDSEDEKNLRNAMEYGDEVLKKQIKDFIQKYEHEMHVQQEKSKKYRYSVEKSEELAPLQEAIERLHLIQPSQASPNGICVLNSKGETYAFAAGRDSNYELIDGRQLDLCCGLAAYELNGEWLTEDGEIVSWGRNSISDSLEWRRQPFFEVLSGYSIYPRYYLADCGRLYIRTDKVRKIDNIRRVIEIPEAAYKEIANTDGEYRFENTWIKKKKGYIVEKTDGSNEIYDVCFNKEIDLKKKGRKLLEQTGIISVGILNNYLIVATNEGKTILLGEENAESIINDKGFQITDIQNLSQIYQSKSFMDASYLLRKDGFVYSLYNKSFVAGWEDIILLIPYKQDIHAVDKKGRIWSINRGGMPLTLGDGGFGAPDRNGEFRVFSSTKELKMLEKKSDNAISKAYDSIVQKKQKLKEEGDALLEEQRNLKGIFSKKRRSEIDDRLQEIGLEISKLKDFE